MRPMAASDHIGLADELIDAARGGRLRPKTLIPGRERIALDIGERPAVDRDDKLVHVRVIEIAAYQRILFVRISPPARYLRRLQPMADQGKVGGRHGAESINPRHQSCSMAQPPCKVSMVRLRLVKTQMSAAISSAR